MSNKENTTTKEQVRSLRGQEVIEEAARLLEPMRFSADRGAYAEGRHVAVGVDPRWNDDNQTIRVLITCYAFGHRQVDWDGLPVVVLPEGQPSKSWWEFLNVRGQTVLTSLPPGDYRLSLGVKPPPRKRVLTLGSWTGGTTPPEPRVETEKSPEEGIVYTVHETIYGEVRVAFETKEKKLAGHLISFSLVEPDSRRVRHSGTLVLTEKEKTPGKWEGSYSLSPRTKVRGPYDLLFKVLPPSEELPSK